MARRPKPTLVLAVLAIAPLAFGLPASSAAKSPDDRSVDQPGEAVRVGLPDEEASTTKPAERDTPYKYQGAYWGLQAHVGLVYRLLPGPDELPGPVVAVSGRLASFLSIADLQLNVQGGMYTARTTDRQDVDVKRLSVGFEAHLHPLFLQHLQNTNFWYWAAGIYIALGIEAEISDFDGAGIDRTEVAAGIHLGAGMDYPLTDVHAGWSLWLGLAYKLRFVVGPDPIPGVGALHEHNVLITLGYRSNNIFFARVPKPTELNYREPALPEP